MILTVAVWALPGRSAAPPLHTPSLTHGATVHAGAGCLVGSQKTLSLVKTNRRPPNGYIEGASLREVPLRVG